MERRLLEDGSDEGRFGLGSGEQMSLEIELETWSTRRMGQLCRRKSRDGLGTK